MPSREAMNRSSLLHSCGAGTSVAAGELAVARRKVNVASTSCAKVQPGADVA